MYTRQYKSIHTSQMRVLVLFNTLSDFLGQFATRCTPGIVKFRQAFLEKSHLALAFSSRMFKGIAR